MKGVLTIYEVNQMQKQNMKCKYRQEIVDRVNLPAQILLYHTSTINNFHMMRGMLVE